MHDANALLDADYLSASATRSHNAGGPNGNGQSREATRGTAPSGSHFTPQTTPMKIAPHFCPANVDPFSTTEWDYRTAAIKDENGKVLFEQTNCPLPFGPPALCERVAEAER